MKRKVVVVTDLHSGSYGGLTPPDWWLPVRKNPSSPLGFRQNKFALLQRETWKWYSDIIEKQKPIDTLFCLGDCIDGPATRSKGTELITSDIIEQCEMAEQCLSIAQAKHIVMVYGTPYHVSDFNGDAEDIIAKEIGADKISGREQVRIDGITFDLRHKVGGTTVPYSQGTAIAKQAILGELWSLSGLRERSQVYLRGHVHIPFLVHDPTMNYLAMTCPGLQWNTKYGVRQCDGVIRIGITIFEIENGGYTWEFKLAKLKNQKSQVLTL